MLSRGRLVAVLFLFAGAGLSNANAQAGGPGAVKVVSLPYRGSGALTLWRQPIPYPGDAGVLNYYRQHRDETAVPNVAFFLVVSDDGSGNGRIVWFTHIYENNTMFPRENWMVDIARPITSGTVYPILLRSISWDVKLWVWQVNLDADLGTYPIALQINDTEHWPAVSRPLTTYASRLVGRDISGVSEIHVAERGGELTINGKRESAKLPNALFHLDLRHLNWTAEYESPAGSANNGKTEKPEEIKQ